METIKALCRREVMGFRGKGGFHKIGGAQNIFRAVKLLYDTIVVGIYYYIYVQIHI